ncbi:SUKH-3 domain-containing protein [Lentzea sp. NPDC003310]|uniref:SUKH-3 domain-containing protein n=1 Tax=Lentzea sp. NPDC003310 TaxID=3154447 RepID=UPI0033BA710D
MRPHESALLRTHPRARTVGTEQWRGSLEEEGFVFPETAVRFLAEFFGLSAPGHGVTRAREALEFGPLLCVGEAGRFGEVGAAHGRIVAPIGELDGRWFPGVDDGGTICFVGSVLKVFGVGDAGWRASSSDTCPFVWGK